MNRFFFFLFLAFPLLCKSQKTQIGISCFSYDHQLGKTTPDTVIFAYDSSTFYMDEKKWRVESRFRIDSLIKKSYSIYADALWFYTKRKDGFKVIFVLTDGGVTSAKYLSYVFFNTDIDIIRREYSVDCRQ
jgi:hypothetical protein